MNLGKFSYLATDIFFAGSAILLAWHRHKRFLKRHWAFLMDFAIFSLPFAYFDSVALRWHAWQYNPARDFNVHIFGAELEAYIFMVLVAIAVSSYTVVNAKRYKQPLKLNRSKSARRNKKNRKLIPVHGTARR